MLRIKDILAEGNLQGRINAALMMERLAQTGRQELIDDLTAILENPKHHEAVKLYAIKGLAELFARQPPPPQGDPMALKAFEARLARSYKALVKYLYPKPAFTANTSPKEKEGAYAVARFFRREALRALGQMRRPALAIDKQGKVAGPIAHDLLRILADKTLMPTSSLSERLEAAVGLCQLRADPNSTYTQDVALYLVGRFIAQDLAVNYNGDMERTLEVKIEAKKKKTEGEKDSGTVRRLRAEPWKLYSARLAAALEELAKTTGDKKVKDLLDKATPILQAMDNKVKAKAAEETHLKQLNALVASMKPKEGEIFKGNADLKVSLEEGEAE
jgi:hypothetical protein